MNDLYLGDCLEVRTALADNSVDTIITDPPYGLEFMGKGWDKGVPGVEFWREFLAVAKPGAMLLAFGGTRTYHRMTCAIEDAGWEIRDCMMWLYGSGFPKSLDISKALDGAIGKQGKGFSSAGDDGRKAQLKQDLSKRADYGYKYAPATDLAKQWNGWGTALKPAWEPIIVAMKPLDGTFAENAEKHGVAGINVDGGRIIPEGPRPKRIKTGGDSNGIYGDGLNNSRAVDDTTQGRWPANLILDEEAAGMLDEQSGELKSGALQPYAQKNRNSYSGAMPERREYVCDASFGGASRFFYCAKASKSERGEGNNHPTVKPIKLMEYLCTLTNTPTGGIVLDPFAGSGTTLLAAKNTGRQYVGIEQSPEYFQIIKARLQI